MMMMMVRGKRRLQQKLYFLYWKLNLHFWLQRFPHLIDFCVQNMRERSISAIIWFPCLHS